jgi:hypothetical protein
MRPENTIVRCIAREKVYDKPGDCPVCGGMDLVKEAALPNSKMVYTCLCILKLYKKVLVLVLYAEWICANGTNRK